MQNANLNRSLKRTFYRLSQRYGQPGTITKRTSAETDFVTGKTAVSVENRSIRRVVRVAIAGDGREVIYTASMMQSLRPFAWQGGQGFNTKTAVFLIYVNELRDWEITPEQWVRYESQNWQIVSALKNEGGWIIEAKKAQGSDDGLAISVTDDTGITDSGEGNVV